MATLSTSAFHQTERVVLLVCCSQYGDCQQSKGYTAHYFLSLLLSAEIPLRAPNTLQSIMCLDCIPLPKHPTHCFD